MTPQSVHDHSNPNRPPIGDTRVLYVAGPGDVIGTYRHWREGHDDPSQVSITYSGQFYDVCRELGVRATVVSHHPRREQIQDNDFTIDHRPMRLQASRGLLYHLGQYCFHAGIVWRAIRDRCDFILPMTETHFAPYWIAVALRKKVVPVHHCTLWPQDRSRGLRDIVRFFDKYFFRHGCCRIMSASREISSQIDQLTSGRHAPIVEFFPSYRRETFAKMPKPDHASRPFRVLFAGRVEADKGIFDLLEVASALSKRRSDIVFDVAGDGSALAEFQQQVAARKLCEVIRIHGYCLQPRMQELLGQSHAVIVPTRKEFAEGFNQVVVEAVLSQRPFITSNVCPALEYVGDAGIEVPPEDVLGYAHAVESLADDSGLYASKCSECIRVGEQFFDEQNGWGAALRSILVEFNSPN